jgi:hypothetical protein
MKDAREWLRSNARIHLSSGVSPTILAGLSAFLATVSERFKGVDPASVARFVRNLRPNRDPRREALRKKWYAARQRVVVIYPEPDGGGYWMVIPAKGTPSDGSGDHIGMFAVQGFTAPSVFEGSHLAPSHRRFYPPFEGTFIEDLPRFDECMTALKDRYLMIAEANPSDSRL